MHRQPKNRVFAFGSRKQNARNESALATTPVLLME